MNLSKIRENARQALAGKWGKGACITLAYIAFLFLIGIVTGCIEGIFGEDSVIVTLLDIATSIIQVPIVFGLGYAFIKLKRNEEVKAFDFVKLGFSNFARAWKIGLRECLKVILPLILLVISIVLIFAGSVLAASSAILGGGTDASVGLMLVGLILCIIAFIWFLVRNLLYSLTVYVAYDNPNMSSLEVVNESARMMKGNRGKIFLLSLSFIGWIILAVFTLGIGYFWLMPYMTVAEICFYEYLLGKNQDNNSEDNGEAIKEM